MSLKLNSVRHPKVQQATEKAFQATVEDIANKMNEYAKEDTGALKGSMYTDIHGTRAYVIWDIEYAAYAYYKGRPSHDKNGKARLRWAQYAHKTHAGEWAEDIRKRAAKLW